MRAQRHYAEAIDAGGDAAGTTDRTATPNAQIVLAEVPFRARRRDRVSPERYEASALRDQEGGGSWGTMGSPT